MNQFKHYFTNLLLEEKPDVLIKDNFDYICSYIPELAITKHFKQNNPYHIYDVLSHTLVVLKNTPKDLTLRLSAIFHDIAKPLCYTVDSKGIGHFYNHNYQGVKITKNILTRLEFEENLINDVLMLIEYHDYPLYLKEKSINKFLKRFDIKLIDHLLNLKRADIMGQNPKLLDRLAYIDEVERFIEKCI